MSSRKQIEIPWIYFYGCSFCTLLSLVVCCWSFTSIQPFSFSRIFHFRSHLNSFSDPLLFSLLSSSSNTTTSTFLFKDRVPDYFSSHSSELAETHLNNFRWKFANQFVFLGHFNSLRIANWSQMSVEKIMKKVRRKIGKYEVGRTIGEGTFAKVKFAKHSETGESFAIKVMAKTTILKHRMVEQVPFFFSFLKL